MTLYFLNYFFLQFSSFQQIKELHKISMSQAFEIQQLKEELNHISFASLDNYIPINSKKLVLDNNYNYKLENYYKLEKLRISSNYIGDKDTDTKLKITNNNVKLLMLEQPHNDMLTIVKQFPNVEELVIVFTNVPIELSHIIYPSKIKKIVLIKMKDVPIVTDISPVVSYYRQQNKEVVIDEIDWNLRGDIYTKYDLWN
jgi:hypothetical protein